MAVVSSENSLRYRYRGFQSISTPPISNTTMLGVAGLGVGLGVVTGASLGTLESLVIMRGATARSGAVVRRMGHT
jgi:hypothetical protein